MSQQLVQYLAAFAQRYLESTAETRAAIQSIREQVSSMSQFDSAPILQQLASLEARLSQQGEQIGALIARADSADGRINDQTAVITALAGKVAELVEAGQADLSGLPALS